MELQTLETFLMWCTIINIGLLGFWAIMYMLAPDLVYRTQSKWFPISRETFNVIFYAFLGFYKILFLVFIAIPYVSLLIIG